MIFNFFNRNKKKQDSCEEQILENDSNDTLEHKLLLQYKWLEKKGWLLNRFSLDKKNILIMDDKPEIVSSVIDDLNMLSPSFDIYNFNIIGLSSKMAGFNALEILENAPDIEIHYAMLDIILGGKKIINEQNVMVDGVDIAIEIWKKFPQADILFFSGCLIDTSSDKTYFKTKFDKYTNNDLNNFILPKAIGFEEEADKLHKFFKIF